MRAPGQGITIDQLSRRSLLRIRDVRYTNPEAAAKEKVVASLDPFDEATVGTALTLASAVSGKLLRMPRRVTVSVTDASYSAAVALSCSIVIVGYRAGVYQTEVVTATATSGSEVTATSTKYYDEVASATPSALTNTANGDALKVGIDGTSFGLPIRIRAVNSVKSIINISSGTEAAPVAISSTTVDADASAIKGITLAATDDWHVKAEFDGVDGWDINGAMAG